MCESWHDDPPCTKERRVTDYVKPSSFTCSSSRLPADQLATGLRAANGLRHFPSERLAY